MARLGLAAWLVTLLTPTPPRLLPEKPQTVHTNRANLCVHTRLTDEVESWKIQRSLQFVQEMGAPAIVEFFPWAYAEGTRGSYDWNHADRIIALAAQQGLTVIARIGLVPAWARPTEPGMQTTLNSLTPAYYPDFARFVGAFAARYKGTVRYIIPWNEPNLSFEWGYRSVSPADYTAFLRQVYTETRRTNPDVVILGGALAPTLEAAGSTNAISDLAYLRGVYAAGGAAYFDALAVHAYDLTRSGPLSAPDPGLINFRRVELLRAIMEENGDGGKPIFVTEMGWNDHPRWAYAVGPGQRIAFTLDALRYAEERWKWARAVCIWNFRTPSAVQSYPDYWTLMTPGFEKKAIYEALQAYAAGKPGD